MKNKKTVKLFGLIAILVLFVASAIFVAFNYKVFKKKERKGGDWYVCSMSAVCFLPQVGNRSFHSNLAFHYSVIFNLYAVTVYSFCSLSLLYFLYRQKVPKNSAQTKIVALSSARELNKFNIPRSSFACHFNPIYFEQGATKLATRGCTIKITPTLRSNSLAQ